MPDNQKQRVNTMNKKFSTLRKNVQRGEQGMNAVENVLITAAFAVLISVFVFIVSSGGVPVAQKADPVHARIPQAIGDMEITSPIIVNSSDLGIRNIIFSVRINGDCNFS